MIKQREVYVLTGFKNGKRLYYANEYYYDREYKLYTEDIGNAYTFDNTDDALFWFKNNKDLLQLEHPQVCQCVIQHIILAE